MLSEDVRLIGNMQEPFKCFNVNFWLLKDYICAFVGVLLKYVLNCNFSKEQSMLSEDDRMIGNMQEPFKCFNVNFRLLKDYICAFVGVLLKYVLNCNFSKEQSMLPEDDRMIETCRSFLSVLCKFQIIKRLYMCFCWCVTELCFKL